MLHPNSPSKEDVRSELQRLYIRRSAIDRLVHALELYKKQGSGEVVEIRRKSVRPLMSVDAERITG